MARILALSCSRCCLMDVVKEGQFFFYFLDFDCCIGNRLQFGIDFLPLCYTPAVSVNRRCIYLHQKECRRG
jgi:hypothetical protein